MDSEASQPNVPLSWRDADGRFAAQCLEWSRTHHRLFGPDLPEHKLAEDKFGRRFSGFVRSNHRSGWIGYAGMLLLLLGWLITAAQPKHGSSAKVSSLSAAPTIGYAMIGSGGATLAVATVLARRDRTPISAIVQGSSAPLSQEALSAMLAERPAGGELWVFARNGFDQGGLSVADVRLFTPKKNSFEERSAV